jgi:hypothetical protein
VSSLFRDAPGGLRNYALFATSDQFVKSCGALGRSLETGQAAHDYALGQSVWEYMRDHPEDNVAFNRGLAEIRKDEQSAIAAAYDFKLVPSVRVSEEYNNNLFFDAVSQEGDWLFSVTPALEMTWRSERFDGSLTGNLEWLNYQDHDDLDTTDYYVGGRFAYQLGQKLRLAGTAAYAKESRPDRHFEESGLVDQSTDYRYDVGASAEYLVTEKTGAALSYTFTYLDYPTELERDFRVHSPSIEITHVLPWFEVLTKGGLSLGYVYGDYEDMTTESYNATVGLLRSVHELWSLEVNAGVMFTASDFVDNAIGTSRSAGWVGDADLKYTGERTTASFRFFHGLAPAYGYEGASLRTSAVVALERRFLHDLSATFYAGAYRNTSDAGEFSISEIDEFSYNVRPGMRWIPSKFFTFEAWYKYAWIDDRFADRKYDQSVVYAGVKLSYPMFDD